MSSFRVVFFAAILISALLFVAGCTQQQPANACSSTSSGSCPLSTGSIKPAESATSPASATIPIESWKRVRFETNMGNIIIALDPTMPLTTGNFETLVQKGYYNGVIFHRVIDGFMIQGGDPTGTGIGGSDPIKDEFTNTNRNNRGTLAMANKGPDTGSSQFFINLVNNNYLDSKHPVFGKVIEGMDVVDAIGKTPTGSGNRPIQNVTIIRAVMI
jgi:peptidylprolyl isomerase